MTITQNAPEIAQSARELGIPEAVWSTYTANGYLLQSNQLNLSSRICVVPFFTRIPGKIIPFPDVFGMLESTSNVLWVAVACL
jgi:hypothetical protein